MFWKNIEIRKKCPFSEDDLTLLDAKTLPISICSISIQGSMIEGINLPHRNIKGIGKCKSILKNNISAILEIIMQTSSNT